MDDKTLQRVVLEIAINGPYVLVSGVVRQKDEPRQPLKMRKATLLSMLASGHLEIVDCHVRLTTKGRRVLVDEKLRSIDYATRMKTRGCVRRSVWVHPDDTERFNEFIATLKGPSE